MAALAGLMTGKSHRMSGHIANRCSTIVPILAKGLWHNIMAHHQKHQKSEHKQPRKVEEMSSFLN